MDAIETVEAATPVEDPLTGQVSIQSKIVAQPQINGKRPMNLNSKEILAVSFDSEDFSLNISSAEKGIVG